MPQESKDQLSPPERALISVPVTQIDTEDLLAMDASLQSLIGYALWPQNHEEFRRARKAIQTELLSRSV